jgi:hypothetical protein
MGARDPQSTNPGGRGGGAPNGPFLIYNQSGRAVAGIGSACGPGASPAPDLRESVRGGAVHHVCVNTAGLHASTAMGLSGRLEFDSSNHGLC